MVHVYSDVSRHRWVNGDGLYDYGDYDLRWVSLDIWIVVPSTDDSIRKRFSTTNFWTEVKDSRATLIVYVGEICRYLLAATPSEGDKEHHVRMMYGNGIRPDIWKRFRDRFGIQEIAELFGSTEGVITMVNQARGMFPLPRFDKADNLKR
jgi:acyl-CoA synthetase (AMP-forming)/AMP-acid ligase II